MDLIGQEEKKDKDKNKSGNGKKIVMISLIMSIIVLILLIMVIMVIVNKPGTKRFKIYIDDVEMSLADKLIITDDEGKQYISLKNIAESIGFTYYRGEYPRHTENANYCYLENAYFVVGFETDSNVIYKTVPKSVIEHQYYEMTSKVISSDDKLYVAIDDLQLACNMVVEQNNQTNEIKIYTPTFLATGYEAEMNDEEDRNKNLVSPNYLNRIAMAYDMIVVSLDGRFGVMNPEQEIVIGTKYNDIMFNEYNKTFIVTAIENSKVGVIDENGNEVLKFLYDGIKVIRYAPLLYEVKRDGKTGILDEKGNIVVEIKYDSLGYSEDSKEGKEAVSIIPISDDGEQEGIVVCQEKKYGIIDIKTGEVILRT